MLGWRNLERYMVVQITNIIKYPGHPKTPNKHTNC